MMSAPHGRAKVLSISHTAPEACKPRPFAARADVLRHICWLQLSPLGGTARGARLLA